MKAPRPSFFPWVPLGLGIAAMMLVLYATAPFGVMYYSDSIRYISEARSVAAGQGFVSNAGGIEVYSAPMYALVMAAGVRIGISPLVLTRVMHAVLFGGVMVIMGLWLRALRPSRAGWWLGALLVFTSGAVFEQATSALTDMLYIAWTAAALFSLDRFQLGGERRWFVISALCAGLGCTARYIGVTMIMTGCVILLLPGRGRSFWRRVAETGFWGAMASAPLVLWLAHNYTLTGTLFGSNHIPADFTVLTFVFRTLATAGWWFVPPSLPATLAALIGGALFLASAIALSVSVRATVTERGAPGDRDAASAIVLRTAAAFALVYTIVMVIMCTRSWAADWPTRYLAPVVLPVATIAAWVLTSLERTRPIAARTGLRVAIPVMAFAALVWPARYLLGSTRYLHTVGGGYATARWRQSAVMRALRADPRSAEPIYANEPNAIYSLTARRDAKWIPAHDSPGARYSADSALSMFRRQLANGSAATVVLFSNSHPTLAGFDYTAEQLAHYFDVELVSQQADGAIYRVRVAPARLSQ